MKHLIFLALLSTMIGCASQPSTYEDKSTPEQRDITATGQAATEAARSNRSTNTNVQANAGRQIELTDIDRYDLANGRYVIYKDGKRDHRAELRMMQQQSQQNGRRSRYGEWASDNFRRKYDYQLKRKIDKEIDRIIDKIF